jgi:hypothetical protein
LQQKISFFQPSKSYKSDTQGTNIAQPALLCGTGEAYPPPPYPKNLITAFFFSGICNKSLLFTGGTRQSCEKIKTAIRFSRMTAIEKVITELTGLGIAEEIRNRSGRSPAYF